MFIQLFVEEMPRVSSVFGQVFNKTSMKELRAKSLLLTAYLEGVIQRKYRRGGKVTNGRENGTQNGGEDWKHVHVDIITPSDPAQRGAQLSLSFFVPILHVFEELTKRGVVVS